MKNEKIRSPLFKYGFTEISDLKRFLQFICYDNVTDDEARFIYKRLGKCLHSHDDGSDYFKEMRELMLVIKNHFRL